MDMYACQCPAGEGAEGGKVVVGLNVGQPALEVLGACAAGHHPGECGHVLGGRRHLAVAVTRAPPRAHLGQAVTMAWRRCLHAMDARRSVGHAGEDARHGPFEMAAQRGDGALGLPRHARVEDRLVLQVAEPPPLGVGR